MLNDADKDVVRRVVAAFNDAVAAQQGGAEDRSAPLAEYGRGLLGLPERLPEAAAWVGFWLGFGAGCAFMVELKLNYCKTAKNQIAENARKTA